MGCNISPASGGRRTRRVGAKGKGKKGALVGLLLAGGAGRLGGGSGGLLGRLGGLGLSGLLLLLLGLQLLLALDVGTGSLGVDPGGVGVLQPERVDNVDDIDDSGQEETGNRLVLNSHGEEVQSGTEIHGV